MRVFVYEYTCAAVAPLPPSLRAEGQAMLAAILDDFNHVPGVEAVTLPGPEDETAFRDLTQAADWTLVIAPEFDGLLVNRCRRVAHAGGRLLGSMLPAIELTADKAALGRLWRWYNVPTPRCFPVRGASALRQFPAVLKPRFGAGSQATCLVQRPEDLFGCLVAVASEEPGGGMLLQPFVAGMPASVAFLLGPNQTVPLAPAAQHLSADGRFHYLGGMLPLTPALAERAVSLGRRAVQPLSGLRGYVGVDLVLGAADDGSEDYAIEINPRLTTSYIGLRALAVANLAELMLRVVSGEAVAPPTWRPGTVHFSSAVAGTGADPDNGNGG
jgi:predicted ATP-grasp superfamily ATP-dependent carboligase